MSTPEETRLRLENQRLRDIVRRLLAMTRGAHGTADLETVREAARLVDDAGPEQDGGRHS